MDKLSFPDEKKTKLVVDQKFSTDSMCKELRDNNYDTSLLSNLSENIQMLFWGLSIIIISSSDTYRNANLPLAVCINNFFVNKNRPMPSIKNVSGLGDIWYLTGKGKKIYLFSDMTHTTTQDCIPRETTVYDYIQNIVNESDKFLDVYIEYGIRLRNTQALYLSNLAKKYIHCQGRFQGMPDCPKNARMHYGDIRFDFNNGVITDFIIECSSSTENFQQCWEKLIGVVCEFIVVVGESREKFIQRGKKIAEKNPYIKKEFDRQNAFDKEYLLNTILNTAYDLVVKNEKYNISQLQSNLTKMLEEKNPTREKFLNTGEPVKNIWDLAAVYYHYIMDLYLLPRIFKTHDVKDSYDPPTARNIIIYAGNAHTEMYNKILQSLGFTLKEELRVDLRGPRNCADITKLKYPLFQ